jgi:hypothetical protein
VFDGEELPWVGDAHHEELADPARKLLGDVDP